MRRKKIIMLIAALIPLTISLALGIIYQHLGLIIGASLLSLEGLYILYTLVKKQEAEKK